MSIETAKALREVAVDAAFTPPNGWVWAAITFM
jgi:hypothetical protein